MIVFFFQPNRCCHAQTNRLNDFFQVIGDDLPYVCIQVNRDENVLCIKSRNSPRNQRTNPDHSPVLSNRNPRTNSA